MGLVRTFNEIKRLVQIQSPTCGFTITAEQVHPHGVPPRIVMFLPGPGQERYGFDQVGAGYTTGQSVQGVIYERVCPVEFHVWMPSGGVDADSAEYPTDEEDPDEGTPWLVQTLIEAIQQTCGAPGGRVLTGGWFDRSTLALGWVYGLTVELHFPVYRTRTVQDVTILTVAVEKEP